VSTPEEIDVARRNLLAELKAIEGRSRNNQGLYEIDGRTLADLIEVLAAEPSAILAAHREQLADAIENLQQSPHDYGGYFSGQTDAEMLVRNWMP